MSDWKSAHLAWIKSTKYHHAVDGSYHEVMSYLYQNAAVSQESAKFLWKEDKKRHKANFDLSKVLDKEIEKATPSPPDKWFVTIGFNHQTWTKDKCIKAIQKIMAMDWVVSAKAVFELHRENGEHPHVHFLLHTKEPKSKIIEKIFRPSYVQSVVYNKSFVDVKPAEEHHMKYIMGDKCDAKQQYVELDRQWRAANNIPDFEKNW